MINTHPDVRMNAAFGRKMPAAGNLAFLSQSGALCTSVLDYAEERQMGFSKFISFGNKADVNEIDLLEYLAKDKKTSVIAMYLEDVTNGRRFIETARDIFWETHKPMLCLKSGRSPEGAKAVSSHTGSLAGSDSVYDAAADPERRAAGGHDRRIVRLRGAVHHATPAPRAPRGDHHQRRRPGHHGHRRGRAPRPEAGRAEPRPPRTNSSGSLPAAASLRNPIDVIGDARSDRYKAAVRTVLEDDGRGHGHRDPHAAVDDRNRGDRRRRARGGQGNPQAGGLLVHGRSRRGAGVAILRAAGIPNYPFPEDGVRALAAADRLVTLHEIPRREMIELADCDVRRARR